MGITTYTYDALDDLTNVAPVQGTGRSFTYNSLKRLTGAKNPELIGGNNPNGTIGYTYDPNGNLQTRSVAGITTTYGYDELDELTSKTYTDSTPQAKYYYFKGWRMAAAAGSLSYQNGYDGLGRVTISSQVTGGVTYPFTYSVNLLDEVTSMITPSGRTVATSYDTHGPAANGHGNCGFGHRDLCPVDELRAQQRAAGDHAGEQSVGGDLPTTAASSRW